MRVRVFCDQVVHIAVEDTLQGFVELQFFRDIGMDMRNFGIEALEDRHTLPDLISVSRCAS